MGRTAVKLLESFLPERLAEQVGATCTLHHTTGGLLAGLPFVFLVVGCKSESDVFKFWKANHETAAPA